MKGRAAFVGLITGAACLALFACSPSTDKSQDASSDPALKPPIPEDQAEKDVTAHFDATRYITNEFIPKPGAPPPAPMSPTRHITIGMYWVLNDENSPWYVAIDKGFFANMGLDVDFIEGGPNRDTMSSLLAGRADIYVGAPESVLFVVNSRTGTDLKMIGAVLKKTPVGWIGIDHSIPSNQHSTRQIGVDDLRGRKIGIQAGGEYQVQIAEYALGLPPGNLKIMAAGATPDALLGGAVDYYEGFSENQPRVLEKEGVMNWTFFSLESIGYHDYFCASTVTADFYHQQSHLLACYTYALNQALQYEIQHPEEAADITMRHTTNYPQTREATLWRIQRDIKIFQGDGTEPLLAMNPAVVQKQMVWLYRFHQIELPTAPLAPATP